MTRRIILALASAALLAAPVSAQKSAPTLKTGAPPLAEALKEPVAKTWATWWEQFRRALAKATAPIVGDAEEPELGKSLDKIPKSIPSNFDVSGDILTGLPFARSAAPDVVGAFRFICTAGQILRDDPIVFPGQPGKSHLHQFFGNLTANAHSTYASLRAKGDSTCMTPVNRSAYWIPAMLDGLGGIVRPDYVTIYYKRRPASDPECARMGKACVDLPRGLRYIFGYNMLSDTPPTGAGYYNCDGPTAKPGHYRLIGDVAPNCPAGNRMGAVITAPECWDGVHLDSPDHRSHMAYPSYTGPNAVYKCPDTHPYVIPGFSLGAWYATGDSTPALWSLSSDDMTAMGHGKLPAGMSLHADWLGAWDDDILARWTKNCINKMLNCSAGDLGDGTMLRQRSPFSWNAEPRTVPIPLA